MTSNCLSQMSHKIKGIVKSVNCWNWQFVRTKVNRLRNSRDLICKFKYLITNNRRVLFHIIPNISVLSLSNKFTIIPKIPPVHYFDYYKTDLKSSPNQNPLKIFQTIQSKKQRTWCHFRFTKSDLKYHKTFFFWCLHLVLSVNFMWLMWNLQARKSYLENFLT